MTKKKSNSNKSKDSNTTNKQIQKRQSNKVQLTRRDERKLELQEQMNSKQLCFCHNYILDTSTAVEAYMTAYPNTSYDSARTNSTRLLNKPYIREYINILLDEQKDLIEITEKEIYRELKRIALTSQNENTRLKAIDQLVKLKGMIQTESSTTNNTLIQIGIVDTNNGTTNDINDMITGSYNNTLSPPPVIIETQVVEQQKHPTGKQDPHTK